MLDRDDRLVLENQDTGARLDVWESAELSSDFLTPCDSFRFTAGSESSPKEIAKLFPTGSNVLVKVLLQEGREAHLIDGVVDRARLHSGRDGRTVSIEGRDFLGRVEDSNVDPRIPLPKPPTIKAVFDVVLRGQFGLEVEQIEENEKTKQAIGPRLKKLPPKPRKKPSRRSRTAPINDATPRDNEGAFSYLQRLGTQYGFHLWAASGSGQRLVVVAGPDYDQEAHYTLRLRRGPAGAANNIKVADLNVDESRVPSHVFVKGTFFGPADRKKNVALAKNPVATAFKPVYLVDQKAKDKESTERIARAFLGRQLRNFIEYRVTVSGMADPETGAVYAVDTICDVQDEDCGVFGRMWVESVTINKGRGGTTTTLKLIPPGTLVLDWQPGEQIDQAIDTAAALAESLGAQSFAKTREFTYNGVEFWRASA